MLPLVWRRRNFKTSGGAIAPTQFMRQIKSFEATDHAELTNQINEWISKSHAIPISISVTENNFLRAFVIYETSTETHRNLGMR